MPILQQPHALFAADKTNSVLSSRPIADHTPSYAPFGFRLLSAAKSTIGFNGELLDATIREYLLSNGYRLHSPTLARFGGPDSLSPFDTGGINAYAYCLGDPRKCDRP